MNKILLLSIALVLIITSCGESEKEAKKQVKKEVVKKPVVVKDTIPEEPIEEPVYEEPKPVEPNKYFLIIGSFEKESNAYKLRDELTEQGFDSEVIVRHSRENQEFYKVSYKGFSDRDEAFNELSMERKLPNNQDVWLLIK
ncbi:SPOR domain-containing protein [Saccharicrinis aurantiacus]|uniref:SPOR domain-containing protein n=1 Tax=Saccharicrinis aurantiacus TaxID=1849719 RepID=UPI000950131A|nr:SPOR domain-containing protein [Saccharicrinis aurantiacus]